MKHDNLFRPAEPIREAWALRFGLTKRQRITVLSAKKCEQLSMCKSDEARRILLGVSR